jgi:hypothetical protein
MKMAVRTLSIHARYRDSFSMSSPQRWGSNFLNLRVAIDLDFGRFSNDVSNVHKTLIRFVSKHCRPIEYHRIGVDKQRREE